MYICVVVSCGAKGFLKLLVPYIPEIRNWFKGGDTTCLCNFLHFKFSSVDLELMSPDAQEYFECIRGLLKNANEFLSAMFHADLVLTSKERSAIIRAGRGFLTMFSACAKHAWSKLELPRWKYQPKYHFLAEVVYSLEVHENSNITSFNPIMDSTQMDEDFIGRVSKFSREVSVRKVHERVLKKYLLSLASKW